MANIENACLWHFEKETGRSEGPFDASGQNFKQRPYASLIREAVQNSMDAHIVLPDGEGEGITPPVEISFSFGIISSKNYPEFFKLRHHIESCKQSYDNEDYILFYSSMLSQFSDDFVDSVPYLKISDCKTTGMEYIKNNLRNPFQAFVRSSQISVKNTGAGAAGSHGYGKAAYYLLSPLRTLLVSTRTEDNRCFFEGASIIGTHIKDDVMLSSVGYYDNNGGQPSFFNANTDDIDNCPIPEAFRRDEPGTDFYIMGFQAENKSEMCEEMIRESLRSYWLAILKGKIVIHIIPNDGIDIVINKDRLPSLMDIYYPDKKDDSKQLRALNPRPYYEAYLNRESGDSHYLVFSESLPKIGKVSMYVKKCKTNFDKIVYMRKPSMLVYATPMSDDHGFYGLFVCEDKDGDKLLKRLENSSHTEWRASNFKDAKGKIYPEGEQALNEIRDFVDCCIETMFGREDRSYADIAGLSDFLYVPDSLIEDDEKNDHVLGTPTGETTKDGSSITTVVNQPDIKQPDTKKFDNAGTVVIEDEGSIRKLEEGEEGEMAGTGHEDGHGGEGDHVFDGDEFSLQGINDDDKTHWAPLNVPIRVFCIEESGKNYHIVKVHSDKVIAKAKVILTVGLDEDGEDKVPIIYSDKGTPKGNAIEDVVLEKGTTTIKILFADNMAHTVIKKVYYESK